MRWLDRMVIELAQMCRDALGSWQRTGQLCALILTVPDDPGDVGRVSCGSPRARARCRGRTALSSKSISVPIVIRNLLGLDRCNKPTASKEADRRGWFLEFLRPCGSDVVYVEGLTNNLYLEDIDEINRYRESLEHLRGPALNPRESVALIQPTMRWPQTSCDRPPR